MKTILQNKLFIATFVADMLSNFGDVLYYLALMNYVLLLPEAKLAISLVTISESLPFLTMIFMGMWGDKTKNKVDRVSVTLIFRVGLYLIIGFAMGFPPALWVVILAVIVNLLSDLAGQYENALFTPISLRIVADNERESMYAFRQASSSILRILFQSSGAILIGIMTYQHLAFFNAGTFLVSLLIIMAIRPSLHKLLKDNPIQVSQEQVAVGIGSFFQHSWLSLKESYQAVKNIPSLKASIVTIAGLNAVFAGQDGLLLLAIKESASFALVSPAITLSSLVIISLLATILGSILSTTFFQNTNFIKLVNSIAFMPSLLFVGFFLQNIYLILFINFISMVLAGASQPKMYAFIVRALPEDRLATIGAGIDTFCTLGLVACRLLVSALVVVLPSQVISLIFLSLSLILIFLALRSTRLEMHPTLEKAI